MVLRCPTDTSYEPQLDKANNMACAPSEDSDQLGHPPSDQSLRCLHEERLGPELPIKHTAKTDQTGDPQADLSPAGHPSFC